MSGQSRMQRDLARWTATPPVLPEGWTRYPLEEPDQNPFAALPDVVEEEVDSIVMVEYRPSSIMGWAPAAAWVGPKDDAE